MKSYYDLIKENIIDFEKMIIEKYFLLDLNETECLVLLRLHQLQKNNNRFLNITELSKTLYVKDDKLSEVIAALVNKGLVTLTMNESNSDKYLEEFSIDETYRELSYIIENKDYENDHSTISIEMKKIVNNLQAKLNKMFTPFEVNTIKKWFFDYKYDQEVINEEIEKILTKKNASVGMIDRSLFARNKKPIESDDIDKVQEIMKRKYGK